MNLEICFPLWRFLFSETTTGFLINVFRISLPLVVLGAIALPAARRSILKRWPYSWFLALVLLAAVGQIPTLAYYVICLW